MSNEMISVPRDTLQKWLDDIGPSRHVTQYASLKRDELRALLARPAEERGSSHGFEQSPNTCRHDERSGVWWREGSITRTGRECCACGSVEEDPVEPTAQPQGEHVACMPVERCYDVRAKMIIAFNEARNTGGDLDDALDAAYKSALRYSPNPLTAEQLA